MNFCVFLCQPNVRKAPVARLRMHLDTMRAALGAEGGTAEEIAASHHAKRRPISASVGRVKSLLPLLFPKISV